MTFFLAKDFFCLDRGLLQFKSSYPSGAFSSPNFSVQMRTGQNCLNIKVFWGVVLCVSKKGKRIFPPKYCGLCQNASFFMKNLVLLKICCLHFYWRYYGKCYWHTCPKILICYFNNIFHWKKKIQNKVGEKLWNGSVPCENIQNVDFFGNFFGFCFLN